jgi:signal transduction histidine kinase
MSELPLNPPHGSQPKPWIARYGIALVSVLAAVALRLMLRPITRDESPFLLLAAAVLVSAAYGGLWPGIVATVVGALAGTFTHEPYVFTFEAVDWFRVPLFMLEGVFISVLAARLQAARRRAELSEAQTRLLEQRILDISDAERQRFGLDIHDGLGQHLTGVAFLSKALQERLADKQLPEAADATKIVSLVSESIGQARALAKGLAPIVLEDGGLVTALTQLASTTSSVFGIQCVCKSDEERVRLELGISTHLYRIAQEAINNAIRHGKARQILIGLTSSPPGLRLWIEDDGLGLGPTDGSGGMGLQIMAFRARMIGGKLQVQRRDLAGGTIVVCNFPLVAPSTE